MQRAIKDYLEGFDLRILSIHLRNFGSYKSLDFNYESNGLTLIQGSTGSGKSTLCDAIPWVLFGKTAKGGAVDEVRSWTNEASTEGIVHIYTNGEYYGVKRVRGKGNNGNDLYIFDTTEPYIRGKDLNDTQKIINNLLGMDYELYLSGAYFHEFSQSAQFFTTTAKNRRLICEQLVDLSLAKKLQLAVSESSKTTGKDKDKAISSLATLTTNINLLKNMEQKERFKRDDWEKAQKLKLDNTIASYESFEKNRSKIISKKCNSCGTVLQEPKTIIDDSPNPYAERLAALHDDKNPHTGTAKDFSNEIEKYSSLIKAEEDSLQTINIKLSDLEQLSEVTDVFRSTLVKTTIVYIEENTNKMLSDFFDAEIRVTLEPSDADKLEVEIYKDGNVASFTQLSKGQRQLLKLTFGLSVMKAVGNHHGIRFNQIFLDEVLTGMDDNLKNKAFKLLEKEATEYDSIYVVEHSNEFKELFINKLTVELINGISTISTS